MQKPLLSPFLCSTRALTSTSRQAHHCTSSSARHLSWQSKPESRRPISHSPSRTRCTYQATQCLRGNLQGPPICRLQKRPFSSSSPQPYKSVQEARSRYRSGVSFLPYLLIFNLHMPAKPSANPPLSNSPSPGPQP